ncbi:hypothetical protein Syun_026390 [Stephania yunnanensis]|uniref:Uncharacterized protein n=1 Tax=Stephania yunnanensis TaxID=152371 RepID=A0AAP0HWZ3_9MAGN
MEIASVAKRPLKVEHNLQTAMRGRALSSGGPTALTTEEVESLATKEAKVASVAEFESVSSVVHTEVMTLQGQDMSSMDLIKLDHFMWQCKESA